MLRKTPLKRSRRKEPTAYEKRHQLRVRQQGCIVCGREASIHHVTAYADRMGRLPRDEMVVVPLCPQHHQAVFDSSSMPISVEMLGHRGFYMEHGIDLYREAVRLKAETEQLERRAA
jgi:hypothetical protein